jgi:hypothetical protein
MSGANDQGLEELAVSHISLTDLNLYLANTLDSVGTRNDRQAIVNLMLARANRFHKAQPETAAANARAALLLASEELGFRGAFARRVYSTENFPELGRMSKQERVSIEQALSVSEADEREFNKEFAELIGDDDALVMAPAGTLPLKELSAALRQEREARRAAADNNFDKHLVVYELWQMLNLAHARNDKSATDEFKNVLTLWGREDQGRSSAKWIEQALTTTGPPPTQRRVLNDG